MYYHRADVHEARFGVTDNDIVDKGKIQATRSSLRVINSSIQSKFGT